MKRFKMDRKYISKSEIINHNTNISS